MYMSTFKYQLQLLAHLQHSLGLLDHTPFHPLLLPLRVVIISNQLVLGEVFNLQ